MWHAENISNIVLGAMWQLMHTPSLVNWSPFDKMQVQSCTIHKKQIVNHFQSVEYKDLCLNRISYFVVTL